MQEQEQELAPWEIPFTPRVTGKLLTQQEANEYLLELEREQAWEAYCELCIF